MVVDALFGNANIEGHDINILIDTGSVGSIVTKRFLQAINKDIDGPTTTKIIDVMGRQSAPLGMVKQLKININGIIIPEDAIVTEALGYNVLLENSWLNKANAVIDYKLNQLTAEYKGQVTTIPITCAERIDPRFFTQIYNENNELELEEEEDVNF